MTETEIKEKLLHRLASSVETAKPDELVHIAQTLEILIRLNKPDVAERIANAYALSFGGFNGEQGKDL